MRKKWLVPFILIFSFALSISGFVFLYYFYNQKIEIETLPSEILMEDEVDIYNGEPYVLTPYLKTSTGRIETGNFVFESSNSAVEVDETGKVILKSELIDDVYITITERTKGISKKIKLNVIYDLYDLIYISGEDSGVPTDNIKQMTYKSSYNYHCMTLPINSNIENYVTVKSFDKDGLIKESFRYSVRNNIISFTAIGLGEGILEIKITNPVNNIDYIAKFSFNIELKDRSITKDILDFENKSLLSANEIEKIETLNLSSETLDFTGIESFVSLKKIILSSSEVTNIENNKTSKITYRVPGKLINKYIKSKSWIGFEQSLIPYEDNPEERYIVCHSEYKDEVWFEKIVDGYPLPIPKENGYTFEKWNDVNGKMIDSVLSENGVHLYAQWKENTYTVNYVVNATSEKIASANYKYTENFDMPTLTVPVRGYQFCGWSRALQENGIVEDIEECEYYEVGSTVSKVAPQGAVNLYDVWVAVDYTLTYHLEGGNFKDFIIKDTFTVKDSFSLAVPQRQGYKFVNWCTDLNLGNEIKTIDNMADNVEVWAKWEAEKYNVYFVCQEGALKEGSASSTIVTYDSTYGALPEAIYDGHQFAGWYLENGRTKISPVTTVTTAKSHTLYAKWDTLTYTVQFDENWKNATRQDPVEVAYGTPYGSLPTPTRIGYEFLGWYTERDGNHKITEDTIFDLLDTQTLYAHWKAKTYNVQFNSNGGSKISEKEAIYDATYGDLKVPVRTGYEFLGWYTELNGGTNITSMSKVEIAENHTLHAHWQAKNYRVDFNVNGGVEDNTNKEVIFDDAYGELPDVSRPGHIFSGWYTELNGGIKITESSIVITADNHTLHAHWIKKCKITYSTSNASISWSPSGDEFAPGTKIVFTVGFSEKNHRKFTINDEHKGDWEGNYEYIITEDISVYASSEGGCFAEGTKVLMADGSYERVENLKVGDLVMVWDFFTGALTESPIALYWNEGTEEYQIINLKFSNGSHIKVIMSHAFFDYDLNTFIFFNNENYKDYIGHKFITYDENNSYDFAVLEEAYLSVEKVGCYSILTACAGNAYIEDMLSLTYDTISGILVLFDFTKDLKYDENQIQIDIEKYGLYTYEEWAEYLTYEDFVALNGQYFKILVGKGILTEEDIIYLLKTEVYTGKS